MRSIDFRMDVLRNGVRFSELRFAEGPSIDCSAEAEISMTLRGSFRHNDAVDLLRDELQPIVILDGIEYPVGVYRPATVRQVKQDGVLLDEIEAYDRALLLSWAKLESRAYHASGSSYSSIINGYLTAAGIAMTMFAPTTATLGSAREWDVGTSYLQIINELLDELAYDHLWFNNRGYAMLQPYAAPGVSNIAHTFGANAFRLLSPSYSRETDIYSRPNVFIVIRTSPDYTTALTATAVNDNPMSELSTVRRGVRIPEVYRVDNIASQAALQTYANKLRDRGMEASETLQISTAIVPDHQVGDTVALTDADVAGLYRESGWSFSMEAGSQMTHKLERTVL